jgi:hypothetical protein
MFRGNSVDFLVGGYDPSVTVTFSGCVFDAEPLATICIFVTNATVANRAPWSRYTPHRHE